MRNKNDQMTGTMSRGKGGGLDNRWRMRERERVGEKKGIERRMRPE